LSFGRKQPLSEQPNVLFECVGLVLCFKIQSRFVILGEVNNISVVLIFRFQEVKMLQKQPIMQKLTKLRINRC